MPIPFLIPWQVKNAKAPAEEHCLNLPVNRAGEVERMEL
jgi:hypothetical protein